MRFLSLFSGIEAATVGFTPLGWECVGVAEIDKFSASVLKSHYPDVPNLGDVTSEDFPARAAALLPDLIVGGPPCQPFSVAGLRKSLGDSRGNLTIRFVEILETVDAARKEAGLPPVIVMVENVLGLLSVADNAFGCLLGALAGEDVALEPAGGKWSNAGCVFGPQRAIAWRVLDAQHFGVAQRRRRLFVVACPLERAHPTQILFELEGERRDSAPSRPTGEETTASLTASVGGVDENDAAGGLIQPYEVANCLTRRMHKGINTTLDEGHTPVLAYRVVGDGAAYETKEVTAPLMTGTDSSANVVLAYSTKPHNTQSNQSGKFYPEYTTGLERSSGPPAVVAFVKGTNPHSADEAPTFKETETAACLTGWDARHNPPKHLVVSTEGLPNATEHKAYPVEVLRSLRNEVGEEAFASWCLGVLNLIQPQEILQSEVHGGGVRPAPFSRSWVVYCALSREEARASGVLQSLREACGEGRTPQGWQPPKQLLGELGAYLSQLSQPGAQQETLVHCVREASEGSGLLYETLRKVQALGKPAAEKGQWRVSVRKLMPHECEFLMGFPLGYTDVPTASDSSRYMALGNSWAVPVVTWIGRRIEAALESREAAHG